MTQNWARWIISGYFETLTPLAIGTGEEERPQEQTAADWQTRPNEPNTPPITAKDEIAPVQAVEVDANGYPFIPGSAIKGMLRALAAARFSTPDDETTNLVIKLFGDIPRLLNENSALQPKGGSAIFPNAYFDASGGKTAIAAIRGRTAIDRKTRTADEGKLWHERAVAPGSRFQAEFILDRATEEEAALLIALLEEIDGNSPFSAFGAGAGQGDGRVKWVSDTSNVKRFGSEQMIGWLEMSANSDWRDCAEEVQLCQSVTLNEDRMPRHKWQVGLEIDGHFLVSVAKAKDLKKKTKTPEEQAQDAKKDAPDQVPIRISMDCYGTKDRAPLLPGSSLDGALSAQAERIWRTISGDRSDWQKDDAPQCHALLFGTTDCAGLLDISLFQGTPATPKRIDFNAIDRFTGGGAESAKFAVDAFEAPILVGEIGLTLSRDVDHSLTGRADQSNRQALDITAAAIGLLALILKDLAEGDIPLGYGTRKGFGRIGKLTHDGGDWQNLLEAIGAYVAGEKGPEELRELDPEKAIRHAVLALRCEAREHRNKKIQKPTSEAAISEGAI